MAWTGLWLLAAFQALACGQLACCSAGDVRGADGRRGRSDVVLLVPVAVSA